MTDREQAQSDIASARWAANEEEHKSIFTFLHRIEAGVGMVNERVNSNRTVAVVVWALFIVALGGIGWVVNKAASTIERAAEEQAAVRMDIAAARVEQQSDAARGFELGSQLTQDIAEIRSRHKSDVKECREDVKRLERRLPRKEE